MNIANVWAGCVILWLVGCGWSMGPSAPNGDTADQNNILTITSSPQYPIGTELRLSEGCYDGTVYIVSHSSVAVKMKDNHTVSC